MAAPYIMTGLDAIRDPRERAEQVGPAVKPVADRLDWMPKDPETLVRIEGALSLGTGALLLTGKFPADDGAARRAAGPHAGDRAPLLDRERPRAPRTGKRSHLLKNAALFGALLMSATEPRRPPDGGAAARDARVAAQDRRRGQGDAQGGRRRMRDARREASRQVRVARAESGRMAAKQAAKAAKAKAKRGPGAGGVLVNPDRWRGPVQGKQGGQGRHAQVSKAGGTMTKIGAASSFKAGKATGALKSMGRGRSKVGLFSRGGNPDIREMAAFRAGQASK